MDLEVALRTLGYLACREPTPGAAGTGRRLLSLAARAYAALPEYIRERNSKLVNAALPGVNRAVGANTSRLQSINWDHTTVFLCPGNSEGVWLNASGRGAEPTVSPDEALRVAKEVRDGLRGLENQAVGGRVLAADLREDLYHGPYVSWAPHVVVGPEEVGTAFCALGAQGAKEGAIVRSAMECSRAAARCRGLVEGTHRAHGVLPLGSTSPGEAGEIAAEDVTPTIPTALGYRFRATWTATRS